MDIYPERGGGGSKPEYPEKTPDYQPENQYRMLEVKIHSPNRESNPRPLTLVIRSLGQNAPALTQCPRREAGGF